MWSLNVEQINLHSGCYFISGIDTDIGKTYATGFIAQQLLQQGQSVITQKMVQTGCQHYADDILKHREMMTMPLLEHDLNGLTMPVILNYPCSPHLASRLQQKTIDLPHIQHCTQQLKQDFDIVLIEGAGGLCVPLTDDVLLIDYLQQQRYPIILVTSGRLGSINHTILSIQAILNRNLTLYAVVYNHIHNHVDEMIAQDTQHYLQHYIKQHSPQTQWWSIPKL